LLDPTIVEDIYPLSPLQEGMLFHYLEPEARESYVEQLSIRLEGELDFHLLEESWNRVIAGNHVLRTVFRWEDVKQPVQVVLKKHDIEFSVSTCRKPEEKEDFVRQERNRRRSDGFDLRDVPFRVSVCELGDCQYEMIVTNHHILYDGWSNGILLKEFFDTYRSLVNGTSIRAIEKTPYKKFIQWLKQQNGADQKEYWRRYLDGLEGGSSLPVKHSPPSTSMNARHKRFEFPTQIYAGMEEMTRQHKLTPAAFFYTAWGMLLQGFNRSGDVVFGVTLSGRQAPIDGIDRMVGLLINTVPFRIKASSSNSLLDVLVQTQERLMEQEPFATASLTEISQWCDPGSRRTLFDTLMVVENYPLDLREGNNAETLAVRSFCHSSETNYDLTLGISFENGAVHIDFLYNAAALEEVMVERIAGSFETILMSIVSKPSTRVSQLELVPPAEKTMLLERFNDKTGPNPGHLTIIDLVKNKGESAPDRVSLVDMAGNCQVTLGHLLHKALGVAKELEATGPGKGAVIAVMMEQSIELACALLGVMWAGHAYLPIDPSYPDERVRFLLQDSAAPLCLVDEGVSPAGCQTLAVQSIPPLVEDTVLSATVEPRTAAYVIYTSGTTGVPKGVVVEHGGVVNMLLFRGAEYRLGPADVSMQLFSFTFDGFVAAFFTPLTCGCRQIFPGPLGPRDFDAVAAAFNRAWVNHFICVPSLFQALLENLEPSVIQRFKFVVLAGDAISRNLLETAVDIHQALELVNEYGVTESSVLSSFNRHQQKEGAIAIGKPISNTNILVKDHWGRLVPEGVPGEMCICGAGLARGYLNRPQLTAEKFHGQSIRAYHTGDLGRWDENRKLLHLGRIDHQVKIRGFRIESREIERQLVLLEAVKEAVVVARSDGGEQWLCAYIVPERLDLIDIDTIEERLALKLPAYMIPRAIIPVESIPLTATGKLDRDALPAPDPESIGGGGGELDRLERRLRDIWSAVLGVDGQTISRQSDFFHLGGHSIKATILSARIHKRLKVKLPLDRIFKYPRLGDMARHIRGLGSSAQLPIEPVERKDVYPMSNAQKRLWIIHRMEENQVAYNMTGVFRFKGDLKPEILNKAFEMLIRRHEILRTSFVEVEDSAHQKICPADTFTFYPEYRDLRQEAGGEQSAFQEARKLAAQPFDLGRPPLLNVLLMRTGEREYVFVCAMYHIIADAWSIQVLVKDLFAMYNAAKSNQPDPLPPMGIKYKDYSHWHLRRLDEVSLQKHRDYWLERFKGPLPESNIPTDFPRPRVKTFNGKRLSLPVTLEMAEEWEQFGRGHNASLFMVLLAAVNGLLHSYTGDTDIVIGSPIAGRQHDDLVDQIGFYVNTLALRTRFRGDLRFDELLNIVKDVTIGAYAHQVYPFDRLIDDLELRRDSGRNPLFDVVLAVQNFDTQAILSRQTDFSIEPIDMDFEISTFDLVFLFERSPQRLEFIILFNSDLFAQDTILAIGEEFIRLMNQVTKNPGIRLDELAEHAMHDHQEISIDSWDLTF
jgi:amino acid adenylation domain-containing protein